MTRSEFLAEVAKAAAKAQRRRRRMRTIDEASLDALAEARKSDPMRGIRVARQVPRCGKVRTNGQPCQAPRLRNATRCRWHGGLRQVPSHPGNVRRLLSGTYAAQEGYKMKIKATGEFWRQLDFDGRSYLREILTSEEWSDMHLVDFAARCLIEARETPWAWQNFMQHLRRRRKSAGSMRPSSGW
jgi:hypothetical protein